MTFLLVCTLESHSCSPLSFLLCRLFSSSILISLSLINIAANYHYEIFLTSMMDDMCGFPSSDSNTSEGYTYYTTPLKEADYEAFQSSWSSGVSLSAASEDAAGAANYTSSSIPRSGSSSLEGESSNAIKAKICSHPLYPKLLEAYFDCQKIFQVGAPLETVNLLNEILHGNDLCRNNTLPYCLGEDPELDEFMETYCNVLSKYKLDLARPYDEATKFLSNMETQLSDLCNNTFKDLDVPAKSSTQDKSNGEMEVQQEKEHNGTSEVNEIKEKLLSKYSGYISSLRDEFYKKKKKGKLPKDARQILLNWWKIHYTWPYPTEADKIALASTTGLDQKQINNWFINQRKRHWKPPEGMQYPSAMSSNEYGSFFLDVDQG